MTIIIMIIVITVIITTNIIRIIIILIIISSIIMMMMQVPLPVDVLSGFISPDGNAYGRPVGVALDKQGALLVADDVGNIVWRVSAHR
jgi:hypothetical protein